MCLRTIGSSQERKQHLTKVRCCFYVYIKKKTPTDTYSCVGRGWCLSGFFCPGNVKICSYELCTRSTKSQFADEVWYVCVNNFVPSAAEVLTSTFLHKLETESWVHGDLSTPSCMWVAGAKNEFNRSLWVHRRYSLSGCQWCWWRCRRTCIP